MRAAIYARYSSDLQSAASIDDQVSRCRARLAEEGWTEVQVYTDRAMSGASSLRPDYQRLCTDARNGRFDVVIAEALDRLSRDLSDIAALHKTFEFLGVRLVTLQEGLVTDMHVGLKGTMNALFLRDLADKTRRGLEGRVRKGASAGGNAYGYRVMRPSLSQGSEERGLQQIEPDEALIVQRIFSEFVSGISPKTISHRLNQEGVPGPRSAEWGPSTIYGNWRRGTGILNNALYIGRRIWNRQRFVKDPLTGKRQARLNPEKDWIIEPVPNLRIISDELWEATKTLQRATAARIDATTGYRPERARRPRYLLSGLLVCGACNGGFSKISKEHYGCSKARNKGTCENRLTVRRDQVEGLVLSALRNDLLTPEMVEIFVREFQQALNEELREKDATRRLLEKEKEKIDHEIANLVEAIKSGISATSIREELLRLESRKIEVANELDAAPPTTPRIHPGIAADYKRRIENLADALNDASLREEAAQAIRSVIDEVRLTPKGGQLEIELVGEYGALLDLAQCRKEKNPRDDVRGLQTTLVAGAGFEPATFRL
ncbi:recombinase family protein [Pacificispira sp.]|uniref:recombinase family protein n=1 Tax=Pacificispira sp. TaxID=2888761 RepID=UPI003B52266C